MQENEVIIVDNINSRDFNAIIASCVKYAIISLPFTVDRMSIPHENRRALNIAKGKIAESLFRYFCERNAIEADFQTPSTPFWTVDNKDFLMGKDEWDIKTNFIYHKGAEPDSLKYTDLPALIPNRRDGDQWSKRDELLHRGSGKSQFLFTFLKNAELNHGERGKEFLEILLTDEQISFLRKLYDKYHGQPQQKKPFSEEGFWKEMRKYGETNFYRLHFKPSLIITGYANPDHWELFKNVGPHDNNFRDYLTPQWYAKSRTGSCNFMNGTLWTKITNATTPISNLPSFASLFPKLKQNMVCGKFRV